MLRAPAGFGMPGPMYVANVKAWIVQGCSLNQAPAHLVHAYVRLYRWEGRGRQRGFADDQLKGARAMRCLGGWMRWMPG
jgi:hypothetical protein